MSSVAEAAKAFEDLGATVVETDPQLADAEAVFQTHWVASAAAAGSAIPMEKHYLLDRGLKEIISRGCNVAASDYIDAASRRAAIGERMEAFFQEYDLLITPGQPLPAFEAGAEFPEGYGFERWHQRTPFTYPFNLTQQPATGSVWLYRRRSPCGAANRRPAIFGSAVLRAARSYEAVYPFKMPDNPVTG